MLFYDNKGGNGELDVNNWHVLLISLLVTHLMSSVLEFHLVSCLARG